MLWRQCTADSSGAQSYSWQTNYNISSNSVSNPFVYPLIDTSYVLTATDLLGCSSNDTILISVIPPYLLDLGGLLILVLDLRSVFKLPY